MFLDLAIHLACEHHKQLSTIAHSIGNAEFILSGLGNGLSASIFKHKSSFWKVGLFCHEDFTWVGANGIELTNNNIYYLIVFGYFKFCENKTHSVMFKK